MPTAFPSQDSPLPGDSSNGFSGGDGTSENPYQISTAKQLDNVRDSLSSHYILNADIDLSAVDWRPIGSDEPFTGVFDGNGHTVRNVIVNIESTRTSTGGFFGVVSAGTIRNLRIENGNINVSVDSADTLFAHAGGIVSWTQNGGLIDCCCFSGFVSAYGYRKAFARGAGISAITERRCLHFCG